MKEAMKIILVYMLVFAHATAFGAAITDDKLELGKPGSSANKVIQFGKGTAKPQIRYNNSSTQLEFSNNGVDYLGIGSGSGGGTGVNLIDEENKNSGFEVGGNANWTNSGGTWSTATSGANLLFGKASSTFDASSTGQYVRSSLVTVTYGMANQACMGQIYYKGGDANLTLNVLDSSGNVMGTRVLEAATDVRPFAVPFRCGAQGTQYRLSLDSTADAAIIAIDRTHLGEQGFSQIGQAEFVGSIVHPLTASCLWTNTGNATLTWTTFPLDSDCGTPVVEGRATAPATKIPAVTFASLPPGRYVVKARGVFYSAAVGQSNAIYRIHDGTSALDGVAVTNQGTSTSSNEPGGGPVIGEITYTTAKTNVTFAMQSANYWGVSASQYIDANNKAPFTMSVYRYPLSTDSALTPEQMAWRLDANIAGANPALGASAVSSYTEITNSGLALTQNAGSASVGIVCNSTNASVVGATVCASGTEGVGITFNAPRAGSYEVCAAFGHFVEISGVNSNLTAGFQLVETAANAQTIIQEGKERIPTRIYVPSGGNASTRPVKLCGNFEFASAGQKTVRLMYEQEVTATISVNSIIADSGAANGQPDIHFTARQLNFTSPMPVLVGPFKQMPTKKTSSYTLVPSDDIVEFDTTSGNMNATLFSAIGNRGKEVTITKTVDANVLTVLTTGGQSIGKGYSDTILVGNGESITLYSDGAQWRYKSSQMRVEWARTNTPTGCAVQVSSSPWITSVSSSGTGFCRINFNTALFKGDSGNPICHCISGAPSQCDLNNLAAGFVEFKLTSAGAPVNDSMRVTCSSDR